jgi:HD-like signal output (HDOD) protein
MPRRPIAWLRDRAIWGAAVQISKSRTQTASGGGEADLDGVIRRLSREVATGDVRLPSLPGIAVRVQQVLEDPRAPRTRVAQVIGADAALAARILRLANSAFLNPSGQSITDLRQALTRLGNQLTRCTAVSFSLQQMEFGANQADIQPRIRELWREGTLVAAIAYALARETRAAVPDEALMAGLMHNIGRLYIAVNAPRRAIGGGEDKAWERVVDEWHPRIASPILKHWKFPAAIIAAVADQKAPEREPRGEEGLTDLLIAAIALQPCVFHRELLNDTVTAGAPFQRLGLGSAGCRQLLVTAADQIKALRVALTI